VCVIVYIYLSLSGARKCDESIKIAIRYTNNTPGR
jgi:hypothetical protein